MSKVVLFIALTSLLATSIYCQSLFREGVDTPWVSGEITLIDGTLLKGIVQFKHELGVINYKAFDDTLESNSFKENKILKVVLLDENPELVRRFYSLPYDIDGVEEIMLFEVLMEFKTWAVLSRRGAVKLLHSRNEIQKDFTGLPILPPRTRDSAKVGQVEGIYIMYETGEIKLYLNLESRETNGVFSDSSTKRKIVDEDLLKERIRTLWPSVVSYAKENSYSFKKKQDLLKILEFYKELTKD